MSAFLRGIAPIRSASALRGINFTQRANITGKPAKDAIGPVETAISIGFFALAILGPSGWVLANLENYKKRA